MRRTNLVILGLIVAVAGSWQASRLWSADSPPSSDNDLKRINAAIAAQKVKLAEVELQVLIDANEKLANTFPRSAVVRLQQALNEAKLQAGSAAKDDAASFHASYIAITGAELNAADLNYKTALAANKSVKNAVPPLELERLRILAELAKLRNDRAQQAKNASEIVLLNWQLVDLREQVGRLAQQVELYRGNE